MFLNPVLTVEEGGVLGGKTERIDELYEEGVRLMTLTWNYEIVSAVQTVLIEK